ncbi:hypothetical protein GCM10020367_66620 [Streptomyces sannanensis]|uniref:DUF397 domain-containing protein n=1 Tax=Streptomyces sannanensis TaxID=285536 RepID=A0ABP6S3S3_9ACTN
MVPVAGAQSRQCPGSGARKARSQVSHVETAATPGTVHVRDSKDKEGPQLAFAPRAWADFVSYASER